MQHVDAIRILSVKPIQQARRSVGAAVIHETEVDTSSRRMKGAEGIHVQPMLFVEAGDHDHNVHVSALSIYPRAMEVRNIETSVHGRMVIERVGSSRMLAGFHGYAETAEAHMQELKRL